MHSISSFLAFLTLFVSICNAQFTLVDHPRIFVNSSILQDLASRPSGSGFLADDYAMIKAEADALVARGSFRKINSIWHRPTDMLCTGLVYLVERQLGNTAADEYAQAIVRIWGNGNMLASSGTGHFGSYAIVLDWIHDALTPAQRTMYADKLGEWLRHYTNTPEIVLRYGGWRYNQTWGPAHMNTPNCRDGITPKLLVALAIRGTGSSFEDDSRRFLDSWAQSVPDTCIARFNEMGGVWAESMGHGAYGPVKVIPWAFEAWRTATGLDWFQLGTNTTFLKLMNRWAVHLTLPFSNMTAQIDDNSGYLLSDTWDMTAPILGARYADPVANRISADFDRGSWPGDWFTTPWMRFISYDPAVQPLTPGGNGWPPAEHFSGSGHVYMRSKWDDPDATWSFFGAGPWYANHSRDDEGHFLIAKKGWLVHRAGGMGHNDDDYYAGGSLVYNIVTVFDSTEEYRRLTPGESRLANGGTKNERDGGLIRHVYGHGHEDVIERGSVSDYLHTTRYTYTAADLTASYRPGKVREMTRQFVYIRGNREFFIIFDRIDAIHENHPKHWFLHIPSEPEVRGSGNNVVPDHVWQYSSSNYTTWLSDPAGMSGQVLSTGKARAFLKTLLPIHSTLTKRGGAGHEFWGHPEEPAAQYNHEGSRSGDPPVVPWRIEIRAPQGNTREYFLNVIEIGEESDTAMSAISLIPSDNNTVRASVVPVNGSDPFEIQFNELNEMDFEISFGTTGLIPVDAAEGELPDITVEYLAPQPAYNRTSITYHVRTPQTSTVSLRIFDLVGRTIRSFPALSSDPGSHTLVWDGTDGSGRNVPPGLYVYALQSEKRTAVGKLIVFGSEE